MVKYRLIVTDLTNTWVSIYWLFIGLYLDLLVPHCTRKLAHIPQTTANKQNLQFLFIWANIAWENYQWNVCTWIRDNSYEKNNLHNVASTMLGLIILCLPNMPEATSHKKITLAMLAQRMQMIIFQEKYVWWPVF